MIDYIRSLYAYSAWANDRVLAAADHITREEFQADEGSGSIRDALAHTVAVQWTWLERWRGTSPSALWDAALFPNVA